ncbi:MAG: ABC transporter ATP-binding protein [Dehalococcoidales bacterium]|nr:ABC transporter ATP-binding protein [Dehalococcoidales bacterium]
MSTYLRLYKLVFNYKLRFSIAFLSVLGSGAFMLISPKLLAWAINYGIETEHQQKYLILIIAALSLFGAAAFRSISQYGQQYLGQWLGQRIAYDLRNAIYNTLQRLSFAYHDTHQTGQLMSRATQDVEAVQMFVQMGVLRALFFVLVVIGAVILMYTTNWRLASVILPFLIVVGIFSGIFASKLRAIWTRVQNGLARLTTVLQENLSGARLVRSFGREDTEKVKFTVEAEALFADSYQSSRLQAMSMPTMAGVWMLAMAAIIWFGGNEISAGRLTGGDLAGFTLYLTLLQMPVRAMGMVVNSVSRAYSAGIRIFEVLDAESAVKEKPGADILADITGHVQFENVSFGYNNLTPVLNTINIDALPGQVIALLGPTGSGKTTVVNLLPRFYDITEGRITIDGTDIRDVTLESLRRSMTIVQQDVFLFTGTIRDNIRYGVPDASPEQVEHAARTARIHEYIDSLPDKYDTWVGERGITLSGGQKQRIAIARTLLLDPAILILDDSTSSVDTETEYQIQLALQEVMKNRTTFVIAQRLRTVQMADQILVLNRGSIVEQGRHEELLEQNGFYRSIYDLELKDQEEALTGQKPLIEEVTEETSSDTSGGNN